MSRGRPDRERRNLPVSGSLRNRWWCDIVMRRRIWDRKKDADEDPAVDWSRRRGNRKGSAGKKRRIRRPEVSDRGEGSRDSTLKLRESE